MRKYLLIVLIFITIAGFFNPVTSLRVSAIETVTVETAPGGSVHKYNLLEPLPGCTGSEADGCVNGKLVSYPVGDANLGKYLNMVIKLVIGFSAAAAMVMIVLAGVEYAASELASSKQDAKERIRNALLGLILAIGAYTLLYTINPDLLITDVNIPTETPPVSVVSSPPQDSKGYNLLEPIPCQDTNNPDCNNGELKTFDPAGGARFGAYLNIIIKLIIGLCALLAVGVIILGGLEYSTKKESGKEKIRGALLGLVLLLGSYTLLYTINPDLLITDVDIGTTPSSISNSTTTPTIPQEDPNTKGTCVLIYKFPFQAPEIKNKTTNAECVALGKKGICYVTTTDPNQDTRYLTVDKNQKLCVSDKDTPNLKAEWETVGINWQKDQTISITPPAQTLAPQDSKGYNLLEPIPCQDTNNPDCNNGELKTFDPAGGARFGAYLNIIIKLIIGLCALLAVGVIILGGLEYSTKKESGKEKIRGALLGLVLLLGSYTLLYTINPDLLITDVDITGVTLDVNLTEFENKIPTVGPGTIVNNTPIKIKTGGAAACSGGPVTIGGAVAVVPKYKNVPVCSDLLSKLAQVRAIFPNFIITSTVRNFGSTCHFNNSPNRGNCADLIVTNGDWNGLCIAIASVGGLNFANEVRPTVSKPNAECEKIQKFRLENTTQGDNLHVNFIGGSTNNTCIPGGAILCPRN